jgi:hypothetical protein
MINSLTTVIAASANPIILIYFNQLFSKEAKVWFNKLTGRQDSCLEDVVVTSIVFRKV